ncbi:LPS assembly lipoprotein LptE [Marinicella rhabdoformis]|uniref:LPS-assembly lipoprotein LptE n=1 Tax=Marinicella rhabdoformis TaxID=2580566 RepID=UPI0012AEBC5D|nr:LPS assembly lipoprotein LptE [Marinicella rhabdoformis]
MKKSVGLVLLVCILISACGYHLKKAVPLSDALKQSYLQLETSSPLYRPLSMALGNQGVQLFEDVNDAKSRIIVHENRLEKVVQSIGVNNRVQEYRLDYKLIFSVIEFDNTVVDRQLLTISRDYSFDIEQITGGQAEENILREQMYQDMADMIIRRLPTQNNLHKSGQD